MQVDGLLYKGQTCKCFANKPSLTNQPSLLYTIKAHYSASEVDMKTMDQKPRSSWPDVSHVPESYVHPLEKRPGKLIFDTCKTIPVVDLEGYYDQTHVVQDVLKATKEFGFFQVQN